MRQIVLLLIASIVVAGAAAQTNDVVSTGSTDAYDYVGQYGNLGLAVVKLGDKCGFIDESGKEVIPLQFDEVGVEQWEQYATYISVCQNGKWGLIDQSGNIVIAPAFDKIRNYIFEDETLVWAAKDGKYGYIDITGKTVVPFEYRNLQNGFFDDLPVYARKGSKYGFIDRNNRVVVPFKYSSTSGFGLVTELAPVSINGKYGYIDKAGREVIPLQYDFASDFCSGLAAVVKNGKVGFVDQSGNLVIPFQFDAEYTSLEYFGKILKASYFIEQVGIVIKGGKYGLVDRQGNTIVPFEYDDGGMEGVYTFNFEKDGKTFYFDAFGTQYSSAEERDEKSLLNLAEKGVVFEQFSLGLNYYTGELSYPKDYEKALYWTRKAAEAESGFAQCMLGMFYLYGECGVELSDKQAYEWLQKASRGDDRFNLYRKYYYGMCGGDISNLAAYDFVIMAALNSMTANAQGLLGNMYYYGTETTPQSYTTAYEWYLKAARGDNREAQYQLGSMFYCGDGVGQSFEQAFYWFDKAGRNGDNRAQNMLGTMYNSGKYVEKSDEKALYWFRKALENGDDLALYNIGVRYYKGEGVEQSYETAFEYLSKYVEIDADDTYTHHYLGVMYYNGWGVEQSSEKAFPYLKSAAEAGFHESQFYLGQIYKIGGRYVEKSPVEAVKWIQAAADGGELKAKHELARMYIYGDDIAKDGQKGLAMMLELAGEKYNYAPAQHSLGRLYESDNTPGWSSPVIKSDERAMYWYMKAAENGDHIAQLRLGQIYYGGLLGVEQSYEKAFELYSKVAAYNELISILPIWYMGMMYYDGKGVEQSYEKAYEYLMKAYNELGFYEICRYLGLMYYKGYGVKQSFEEAHKYFSEAYGYEQNGDAESQYYLGLMYQYGLYVKQSNETAAKLFQYASDKNYTSAQVELGYMYVNGLGVTQSYNKAFELYSKAAAANNATAQRNLSIMYYNGWGTQQSPQAAFTWRLRAANNNNLDAQYEVATMYESGYGVNVNIEEARRWYSKCAAQGNLVAKERLEVLSNYKMPLKPTAASMTWIDFQPTASQSDYKFKVGINSTSKIESVRIYINGAETRGINTVVNDNYDMTVTRNISLNNGDNTIRVEVTNAAGMVYTEKTVSFHNRSLAVIDWFLNSTVTKDRQFTIRAGIKSASKIESCKVYVNNQIDRGIQLVKDDSYAMAIERTVTLTEGNNDIVIEVQNAGGTQKVKKTITYTADRKDIMFGERRIAFIIGNANYDDSSRRLKNPVNDATDIAAKLKRFGFSTILVKTNLSRREMENAIVEFENMAKDKYDVALFFYAGHGLNYDSRNYMVPVDANIGSEDDIPDRCILVDKVLRTMSKAHCRMRIVMLDACRDNPFTRSLGAGGFLNVAPNGVFVSYSTRENDTAMDGVDGDRNSPYTRAVLQVLDTPNLKLHDFFVEVRTIVSELTNGRQKPNICDDMDGEFIFNRK